MSRSVLTPCFAVPFPAIHEPVLYLDREPLFTRLSFINHYLKEDHPMNKSDFVTYCIRHHEDFPEVGEITLKDAQVVLDNAVPGTIPDITAQEFTDIWNTVVHDPTVMTLE